MSEALLQEVRHCNIPIFDHRYVIKILKDSQNRACGIVCLNKEKISESNDLTINVFMDAIETVRSDFTVLAIGEDCRHLSRCRLSFITIRINGISNGSRSNFSKSY